MLREGRGSKRKKIPSAGPRTGGEGGTGDAAHTHLGDEVGHAAVAALLRVLARRRARHPDDDEPGRRPAPARRRLPLAYRLGRVPPRLDRHEPVHQHLQPAPRPRGSAAAQGTARRRGAWAGKEERTRARGARAHRVVGDSGGGFEGLRAVLGHVHLPPVCQAAAASRPREPRAAGVVGERADAELREVTSGCFKRNPSSTTLHRRQP